MNKSILIVGGLAFISTQCFADTVKVYAAASLTNALNEITQIYQHTHPQTKIVNVLGASSALAKQIEAGAASDVYFSADMDWMNYLVQKQKIAATQVKPLLQNQLVMISPIHQQATFKAQKSFNFAQSFQGHLCTGQMESVPVGKYAKQSLIHLNWLDDLKGRIVGTDDVRSALAFVERGECVRGIVYKTDAMISKKVKVLGTFTADSHHPIDYPVALTLQGQKNPQARKFIQFMLKHPQAKHIFIKYGFTVKG